MLASKDAYLAAIVNGCNDAIIGTNSGGTIVSWNPASERIFGYAADEIIGRSMNCLLPPDEIAGGSRMRSFATASKGGVYFEALRLRKDGEEIDVALTVSEIRDQTGHIVGASTIVRDISEHRRSEQELSRAVERCFDLAGVIVVVLNDDSTIRMINQRGSKFLGYDEPSDVTGKSWVDLCVPDRLQDEARAWFSGLFGEREGGDSFRSTAVHSTLVATKAGAERTVAWYDSVLTDVTGRVVAVLKAGTDITDRLTAEKDLQTSEDLLRQAQKMEAIGNLTGGMAHDFNNLLGIIILNLDVLPRSVTESAEIAEPLKAALDAALRGADLTRRLLAFARRQPLQPQQVDPNQLITSIFGLLRRTLGEAIVIDLELAPEIWPVNVDPIQLESSLVNLANNARDAMSGEGRLTIVTKNCEPDTDHAAVQAELPAGSYVAIEVIDTGMGMIRSVVDHIFEPFYTTKEIGKGSGLGLSMVFGFAKQSGGHLSVSSEPGTGTTFRLYLRRATAAVPQPKPQEGEALFRGHSETILVVEDNAAMRDIVVRQLMKLGYRVIAVDSAAAALPLLESEQVELLFTDVVIPGKMSGYRLADHVLSQWPRMKVVLTSGFSDPDIRANANNASRCRLLIKPYRLTELSRCMAEVLGS